MENCPLFLLNYEVYPGYSKRKNLLKIIKIIGYTGTAVKGIYPRQKGKKTGPKS